MGSFGGFSGLVRTSFGGCSGSFQDHSGVARGSSGGRSAVVLGPFENFSKKFENLEKYFVRKVFVLAVNRGH